MGKQSMSKMNHRIIEAIAAILLVAGCAKEREYKPVYKEEVLPVSLISTTENYLYLPSVVTSGRSSAATRPNWMGDQKLVRFQWADGALKLLEIEVDPRFVANPNNAKPVLEIPVKQVDYRCATNDLDECTNKEEENTELSWDKKRFFKADFSGTSIQEVNFLPTDIANLFDSCYSDLGSRVVGFTVEQDAVNVEIEKTFRASINCLDSLDSLSDLTFNVRHIYSMVKLSSISTPGYAAVNYPKSDENTFGFFTTSHRELAVDNNDQEDGQVTRLNRWAPSRERIEYVLSPEFSKREHAGIRKATIESVDAVNLSLEKSGAKGRIVLRDWNGERPGDLRHNMIVMVEDPQATNVLGYGPSAANPLTGEIVNGRVVMYLGTLKKFIWRSYDEVIQERREAIANAEAQAPASEPKVLTAERQVAETKPGKTETKKGTSKDVPGDLINLDKKLAKAKASLTDYVRNREDSSRTKDRLEVLAKYCAYPAEFFNFDRVVGTALAKKLNLDQAGIEGLKYWKDLTDAERQRVIDITLPYIWVPTLVHEIGHNLGLRHNFAGSEDKDHFFTREELIAMGASPDATDPDVTMPFSSVMDYPDSDLNFLRLMGKYDLAALRFAYTRKVETADGQLVEVPSTLESLTKDGKVQLADYGYCTDEHVGINAGCRRFDEGTNYTEIAQHLARAYERSYKLRNFRNGKRNFSLFDEGAYLSRRHQDFMDLRVFFEIADRLQNDFQLTPEQWETIPFLKDLEGAVQVSEAVFLKVLGTPDVMCSVARATDPKTVVAIANLAEFGDHLSCFDPGFIEQINPAFVITGQTGKAFLSKKDPASDNPWADQIDVRGIWGDKILAAKMLTQRKLGYSTFDRHLGNYLDSRPGMHEKVTALADQILWDSLGAELDFKDREGRVSKLGVGYTLSSTHRLKGIDSGLRKALGLGAGETQFSVELARILQRDSQADVMNDVSRELTRRYRVHRAAADLIDLPSDTAQSTIAGTKYFASRSSGTAVRVIDELNQVRVFAKVEEARLIELLKILSSEKPELPADLTAEEKAVVALGAEKIVAFLEGELQTEAYLQELLESLADL